MKPILFFDFDDVLVYTRQVTIDFLTKFYGVQIPDELNYGGNSVWQMVVGLLPPEKKVSREQFYEDCAQHFLTSHDFHAKATPIAGAEMWVPRLAFKYDLWIVTARQEVSLPVVTKLSRKFFGNHIAGMHFVSRRLGERNFQLIKSKKDFIADFPGMKVAFFDDTPSEVREVQKVIPAYLFDPGHQYGDEPVIRRQGQSWEEIADLLL